MMNAVYDQIHFFVLEHEEEGTSNRWARMFCEEDETLLNSVQTSIACEKVPVNGIANFLVDPKLAARISEQVSGESYQSLKDYLTAYLNKANGRLYLKLFFRECESAKHKEEFLTEKTTILFELFNDGVLRGSDGVARGALLDAFSVLPSRFLSSDGRFMAFTDRKQPTYRELPESAFLSNGPHTGLIAGIDKFPSLISHRGHKLMEDGNRIVPGAMIRDGVYIGKRNIFMFHTAINITAYIGDDNIIDSHASIGSGAQIGNKNKIASFVSLEGILSPANARVVTIGNDNFLGTFARIGTAIEIGDNNFIGSGVNISAGTKIKDCRCGSQSKGEYLTFHDLNGGFNNLVIAPNNAQRLFNGLDIVPGEYILFDNTPDFMSRFDGDLRIRGGN